MKTVTVELTPAELEILDEALDTHYVSLMEYDLPRSQEAELWDRIENLRLGAPNSVSGIPEEPYQ